MLGRLIKNWYGESREKRRKSLVARGFAAQSGDNLPLAIDLFDRAVALDPARADTRCLLGNALKLAGELERAVVVLRATVEGAPDSFDAHLLFASVLPVPKYRHEAIAVLRRALELGDDSAGFGLNFKLAGLLRDAGQYEEAAKRFEVALDLYGDSPEWNIEAQLANVWHAMGRVDDAREGYARAWEKNPVDLWRVRRVSIFPPIPRSREHIARIRAQFNEEASFMLGQRLNTGLPETEISHTDFYLAYHGLDDKPCRELLARMYQHAYPSLAYVSPNLKIGAHRRSRLRIGIVSKYFKFHTIGRLMRGFFQRHNRAEFELTAFVFEDAGDDIAREIHSQCERTIILKPVLEEARRQIEEVKVDILFYADIGMEPFTYFMAFSRLAPIQCLTWGHPVTSGLPQMDYFISSVHVEPLGAAAHYTEQLACLPDSCAFVCYSSPETPRPFPGRADFKIPEDVNLYFCPQTLFKMHPDFDAMIGGILRADPKALLLIIDNPSFLKPFLLARWSESLKDVLPRIRFLPVCGHDAYLALLGLADVVLDTPHFSGGNSSLEAFAMGAPVVTLPGDYARSRFTYASYSRMGVMDCVAKNQQEYVEIALRLGTDRDCRTAIRERIVDTSECIFEDVGTVRALERFFTEAVEKAGIGKLT